MRALTERAAAISLAPHEFLYAAMVGVTRQIDNLRGRRQDRYGAGPDEAWRLHIEGACGELAVARYLRTYWSGELGNLGAADVGKLQVRTRAQDDYDLILHPGDADDHVFVLVTGRAPHFTLRGWIRAGDGKQQRWWQDPAGGRPAFFVPQDALEPMDDLWGVADARPR